MLASARLTRSPQAFPSPGVPRRGSPDLRPSRPAGGACDTRDTRDRSAKARRSYTRIPNAGSSMERTGPPGQSACGSCGFAFRRAFGFPVVGLRFGGGALGGGEVVGFWRDLVAWGGFEERAGAGPRAADADDRAGATLQADDGRVGAWLRHPVARLGSRGIRKTGPVCVVIGTSFRGLSCGMLLRLPHGPHYCKIWHV